MVTKELDFVEILSSAQDIADMILSSVEMSAYIKAKENMAKDQEAQSILNQFAKVKEQYEEVQRFGKYHPDYRRVSDEARSMKRKLNSWPTIQAYKKAENDMDELLYRVCRIIADGVSQTIKVPSDNPLYNLGGGCSSGGCGTGGSCGCGGS